MGPEGEVEKVGRCGCETELSARDLSCSDQLKPPLSPDEPGLPLFVLARRAWAPTDMRRVKDAFEGRRAGPAEPAGPSSSSIALSSSESERSETLPRRPPKEKGVACVGDVPDKPSVEIDKRRRWSWAAAVEIGPGKGAVGPPVLLDRPKMELKVWVVKEPRRFWVAEGGVFSLLDMAVGGKAVGGGVKRGAVALAGSCRRGAREIFRIALSCSLQLREYSMGVSPGSGPCSDTASQVPEHGSSRVESSLCFCCLGGSKI